MTTSEPLLEDSNTTDGVGVPVMEISDIIAGDLLFMGRPSLLQTMCRFVGDPFRHSGIVVSIAGELHIVEIGHTGVQSRPVDEATGVYDFVCVGRLDKQYRRAATKRALAVLQANDTSFPYWAIPLLFLSSIARHAGLQPDTPALRCLGYVARWLERNCHFETCASFVARVLSDVGLSVLKTESTIGENPVRPALAPNMVGLAMPADVWFSSSIRRRFMIAQT